MLWSRKTSSVSPVGDTSRLVGLDLSASRARAIAAVSGRSRVVPLQEPCEELALFITQERRQPALGQAGLAICRKVPHLVCSNFLPCLGQPREWKGTRGSLTPDSAMTLAFEALRPVLSAEASSCGLVVPAYLTPVQVQRLGNLAHKARVPLSGTATLPMAIAAHRSAAILASRGSAPHLDLDEAADGGSRPDWIVPMRAGASGPGVVLVIDADEHALSATLVQVTPGEVSLLATAYWNRIGIRAWKDRLVDGLSDRCVRVCRRDPRDSAEAEQALFDQLEMVLERAWHGQMQTLSLRASHWYQDLRLQPHELDGFCGGLIRQAMEGIRELLATSRLPMPPRVVWLTHSAARLPGLAATVYQNSPESTTVAMLPASAGAEAAAALQARWLTGRLERAHLDVVIPLEATPASTTPKIANSGQAQPS